MADELHDSSASAMKPNGPAGSQIVPRGVSTSAGSANFRQPGSRGARTRKNETSPPIGALGPRSDRRCAICFPQVGEPAKGKPPKPPAEEQREEVSCFAFPHSARRPDFLLEIWNPLLLRRFRPFGSGEVSDKPVRLERDIVDGPKENRAGSGAVGRNHFRFPDEESISLLHLCTDCPIFSRQGRHPAISTCHESPLPLRLITPVSLTPAAALHNRSGFVTFPQ